LLEYLDAEDQDSASSKITEKLIEKVGMDSRIEKEIKEKESKMGEEIEKDVKFYVQLKAEWTKKLEDLENTEDYKKATADEKKKQEATLIKQYEEEKNKHEDQKKQTKDEEEKKQNSKEEKEKKKKAAKDERKKEKEKLEIPLFKIGSDSDRLKGDGGRGSASGLPGTEGNLIDFLGRMRT
jgi:hypothetical protein